MKKIAIFVTCLIITLGIFGYFYQQYSSKKSNIEKYNVEYEQYYNKEISGNTLASIINKTIDLNERNLVEKDEKGKYTDNGNNSINIDLKFQQSDTIFAIETIYMNDISTFIKLYGQAKFKCTKIEYHESSKYVKYLYFEEIQ